MVRDLACGAHPASQPTGSWEAGPGNIVCLRIRHPWPSMGMAIGNRGPKAGADFIDPAWEEP